MKRVLVIVVVVVLVASAGALYWRHTKGSGEPSEVPSLLLYAPADAKAVVYVDLGAIRSSSFIKELAALAPPQAQEREYLDFVQATGFDYTRDLNRAVIIGRQQGTTQSVLAVAEGRYDRAKIAAYALRSGKLERANGAEIYVIPQLTPGNPGALAFLAFDRIAVAQGPDARATLETLLRQGPQQALDPTLRARVMRVAGSPLFGVGQVDQISKNIARGEMRSDQLENLAREVRWVTAGVRPEGELLHIAADGECPTPESAHQLGGTLDGLRMLGQMMMSDPKARARLTPEAAGLFDTILKDVRVSQDGPRVRLTLEITHAELRDFLHRQAGTPAPAGR